LLTSIGQTCRTLEHVTHDELLNHAALRAKVLYLLNSKAAQNGVAFVKTFYVVATDHLIRLPDGNSRPQRALLFHELISVDAQEILAKYWHDVLRPCLQYYETQSSPIYPTSVTQPSHWPTPGDSGDSRPQSCTQQ
jgi:hypothetical protein